MARRAAARGCRIVRIARNVAAVGSARRRAQGMALAGRGPDERRSAPAGWSAARQADFERRDSGYRAGARLSGRDARRYADAARRGRVPVRHRNGDAIERNPRSDKSYGRSRTAGGASAIDEEWGGARCAAVNARDRAAEDAAEGAARRAAV